MDLNAMAEKYPELNHLLRPWRAVVEHAESDGLIEEWLAAEVLNIPIRHLRSWVACGIFPAVETECGTRLRYADVRAYKQERDAQRQEGLRRLTQMSQEMGLYDHEERR